MTQEQLADLKRLEDLKSEGNAFIAKYHIPNVSASEFQVFWYQLDRAIRRNDLKSAPTPDQG